ncbi:hypothetical protein CNMCM8980_004399 [Aspergillus fumigatiaffinis]|uniref:Uncharacterized protein n=1 Tax=Aspergillus fumigatiaffinis TaxID=340414 RepID=A0A8H4GXF2_9EURO|nr:hypothetical protein CNMCM5878_001732 [Aspergillus fumigatiaffinis]KAF4230721.1 hypothetical protein CNMCM6457_005802 [Aspergillus fumigatiaffinis]KAF4238469.1 hypothetical protein CNMCM6805_006317 [Aspergillus fumigatiaffinis]KAF4249133.1 hypothetical protein CNMCM8980_004399 [Aspergillus fumigatiaffinis]
MQAINKMLMHRFARHGLLTAVFFTLLMTVWSLNLDFLIPNRHKTAQERYLEEEKRYPSVFSHVVSTLDSLAVPPSHDDRTILEDPRFEEQGSKIPRIYRPYPDYGSQEWQNTHRSPFVPCKGPRGKLLNESLDDQVGVYVGVPHEFPSPMFGSHEAVGFNGQVSFDRYTRYGAYGFGEDESHVSNWIKPSKVKWNEVNWSDLQNQCYARNAARFSQKNDGLSKEKQQIAPESRTAVLIRTYVGKKYAENDLQAIRSMITELSLQSGGEYSVFLLLHVKDSGLPIDQVEVHQKVLKDNIPEEFWNMTILWNEPMVAARYPNLDHNVVDVHHAQWLSVQNFALRHPEFDFVWNWEVDARFTGHHYEYANKVAEFGRKQPRRGMWERNARFYIPAVHGDYDSAFRKFVEQIEDEAVWGPLPIGPIPVKDRETVGPSPPVPSPRQDSYAWGVGEEADYIGFLPIFHPIGTDWIIRNEVSGYIGKDTPRRASLITHSRLSRRLLLAMDAENLAGRHMGSEMFPVTVALHHGLKAITAPHPIYSDKNLPPESVDKWFNSGVNGRAGSTKNSPFSWGREARFRDISWYYRANLAGRLYWNFLGWRKEGTGGKLYETLHGRVCLPSILFHPVKDVRPDADNTHYKFDYELGYVAIP